MVANMILTCTLNYEGQNLPVEQIKHDIGAFAAEHNYDIQAYYEWQHGILICEMPDEMALQFALKYPSHADKFINDSKFLEQYPGVLQFELQDPTQ